MGYKRIGISMRAKILVMVTLGLAMSRCFGSTVEWDAFAQSIWSTDETSGGFQCYRYNSDWTAGLSCWIDVFCDYNAYNDGRTVITATGTVLEFIGNWVEAEYGSRIDASTTRGIGRYFEHGDYSSESNVTIYDVVLRQGETTYLAFCGEQLAGHSMSNLARTGVYLYGWVSLTVDENGIPKVTGSAIDLDGGPMVVGGGAWTGGIPEPTSGMLLLIGAAVLGLRRVKKLPCSPAQTNIAPPWLRTGCRVCQPRLRIGHD